KARAYLLSQFARQGRSTRHAIVQALRISGLNQPLAMAVAAEAKTLWEHNLRMSSEGSIAERAVAAEELGRSGRAEAVDRLIELTIDGQVSVAAAAARGLGEAGDGRAVPALTALLQENSSELRQAGCEALGRLRALEAVLQLEHVAKEKSTASASATAALLSMPRSTETNRALCDLALEAGPAQAAAAGRAMRSRGGCPMQPILEKLAHRRPGRVARTAAERANVSAALTAVEALGPTARRALSAVLPLMRDSPPAIRAQAVAAVAEIGDPSARQAVQGVLDEESQKIDELRADWISGPLPNVYSPGFGPVDERGAAADKLLAAKRIDATPLEIVEKVAPDELQLFLNALRALGSVGGAGAQPILAKRSSDPNLLVRSRALLGLVRLDPQSRLLSAKALEDPDPSVRAALAQALVNYEDGQRIIADRLSIAGADALMYLEALSRVNLQVRPVEQLRARVPRGGAEGALAASLLGTLQDREGAGVLLVQLEAASNEGRKEMLLALSHLGDASAAEVVARDLYHDSSDIRAAAAATLSEVGGPQQLESLFALQGDYYRKVREAADRAVAKLGPLIRSDKAHGTQ
ncbi:MAG TPA: HEAT repeat domain-containing protein, partial [Myxococcaceae bacterium]|nr:HEAT repeat domain-containing protein [Myxococcaceae bacterium]